MTPSVLARVLSGGMLVGLGLTSCTNDFDSFVVVSDAGTGGSAGGSAGSAGSSSTGGQAGAGSQGEAGGQTSTGGASGAPGCRAIGDPCQHDDECCDQHCPRVWDTDPRDCDQNDRCVACASDDDCGTGRCEECVCADKQGPGAECDERSDCLGDDCSKGRCK